MFSRETLMIHILSVIGCMFVIAAVSALLRYISEQAGVSYPPAMLFLLLLCGVIMLLFQYSLILSRNQEKISRLAQEISLLKNELEKLKKQK